MPEQTSTPASPDIRGFERFSTPGRPVSIVGRSGAREPLIRIGEMQLTAKQWFGRIEEFGPLNISTQQLEQILYG
ncbi:MAG: hypothetical protein R3257_06190 [bacterium]|nr:hypothetical protein [bacterium]